MVLAGQTICLLERDGRLEARPHEPACPVYGQKMERKMDSLKKKDCAILKEIDAKLASARN
jgi:hypothetical protein